MTFFIAGSAATNCWFADAGDGPERPAADMRAISLGGRTAPWGGRSMTEPSPHGDNKKNGPARRSIQGDGRAARADESCRVGATAW